MNTIDQPDRDPQLPDEPAPSEELGDADLDEVAGGSIVPLPPLPPFPPFPG